MFTLINGPSGSGGIGGVLEHAETRKADNAKINTLYMGNSIFFAPAKIFMFGKPVNLVSRPRN
jgi:hypothetical protein